MAKPLIFTPIKPHFFQPLLPGFHHHLMIPAAFFMKFIEGRSMGNSAKLRSNASDKTWEVKMEGRRRVGGWEEFAVDHDLRIGDFVVFRHEGNMVFHVTAFGPSCCSIQYAPFHPHREDDIVGNHSKKKKATKNSDLECSHSNFVAPVTASNLRYNSLFLPIVFVRSNALNKIRCGIVLRNEHGRSWMMNLRHAKSRDNAYLTSGWRRFCRENGLNPGAFLTFKLVWNGRNPTLQLYRTERGYNDVPRNPSEAKGKKSFRTEPRRKEKVGSEECSKRKEKKTPRQNPIHDSNCRGFQFRKL